MILEMKPQDTPYPNGLCGLFQDLLCPWAFGTFFTDILLSFFRSLPWVIVGSVLGVVWDFSLIVCRRGRCTRSVAFRCVPLRLFYIYCSYVQLKIVITVIYRKAKRIAVWVYMDISEHSTLTHFAGVLHCCESFWNVYVSFIKFIWLLKEPHFPVILSQEGRIRVCTCSNI